MPASKAALMNCGSPYANYLATHGVGASGTIIRFDPKEGKYRTAVEKREIAVGSQFVVVSSQIQGGWRKFMGEGNPPKRVQGNLSEGYVPPARDSLGDTDESEWPVGKFSGKPEDPWQFELLLPLQSVDDGQLYIFSTSTFGGRRAVDAVIAMCGVMHRAEPNDFPVVKLGVGGYQSKKFGWVKAPCFDRVGKSPKADTAAVNTSLADDMSDEIPF